MIHFPFTAIVGQTQLKTALLLCAVDPSLGGVLIRGDKGTAKSTAARALTDVLPSIARVPSCAFNCAPSVPCVHCETCVAPEATAQWFPVPFITLPLGATEDRVLGTLDLARALAGAERVFQAGLLASAHRGILYIDEVNLLADHLVDVLLDVAAMGVNSVQREGLSIQHPARFTLIGTMNLEEGDLRPQLLDRFGLMVEVTAPREKTLRSDVVRRRIAFEADPAAYVAAWAEPQAALQKRLADAQRLLAQVVLDDALLDLISHLCCEFEVASLRADIVMHKTARALAALDARTMVSANDVRGAAELVLPHRRRRTPFEQSSLDLERLDKVMEQAGHAPQQNPQAPSNTPSDTPSDAPSDTPSDAPSDTPSDTPADTPADDDIEQENAEQENAEQASAPSQPEAPQQVFSVAPGATARPIALDASPLGVVAGRRSKAYDAPSGRAVRAVPDQQPGSLALGATLRSAALRNPQHFQVTQSDLHQQIRVGKSANLILFVVDASGSMAAQSRMEAVKGAVLALLTDAYQRRDEVAVIAFRGASAQVLLAPTRSVERAEQALRSLPTGGRTPLPHALQLALETLQQASAHAPPLLVILSDGRANVALDAGAADSDPWRDTLALAALLAERAVPALVFDTESGYLRLGRAAQLAHALGAQCLTLEQLSADNLALTIRASLRA